MSVLEITPLLPDLSLAEVVKKDLTKLPKMEQLIEYDMYYSYSLKTTIGYCQYCFDEIGYTWITSKYTKGIEHIYCHSCKWRYKTQWTETISPEIISRVQESGYTKLEISAIVIQHQLHSWLKANPGCTLEQAWKNAYY